MKYIVGVVGIVMLTSCAPQVVSLVPNYTRCCKKIASKTYYDNMDMSRSPMVIDMYYKSNPRIRRIEYEQSNQADADGVCIKYERRYTSKAKSGYLYVNKVIMDSLPEYHHFRYSIDGDVVTKKSCYKLLRLKKSSVKAINGDSRNNVIDIRTK
ncbi:MAG: hypothetical protein MJZ19_06870 [Paludibacteraceae bacterium]|nr:hypothetical protein [Paludibacteraceae bacterium]